MNLSDIYDMPKRGKCGTYGEVTAQLLGMNPVSAESGYYSQDVLIRCNTEEDYVRMTASFLPPDDDNLIPESDIGKTIVWNLKWFDVDGEKKLAGYPKGD